MSGKACSAHGGCLLRLSRERKGLFCSRGCLLRLSRERKGLFCSRGCLPRLSRERKGLFCSRGCLPRLSRERKGLFCSWGCLLRLSREQESLFRARWYRNTGVPGARKHGSTGTQWCWSTAARAYRRMGKAGVKQEKPGALGIPGIFVNLCPFDTFGYGTV